jgi:hypothetical protein
MRECSTFAFRQQKGSEDGHNKLECVSHWSGGGSSRDGTQTVAPPRFLPQAFTARRERHWTSLRNTPRRFGTEPGSDSLNAPRLTLSFASSKQANKQWAFVGSSSARLLHESPEHSGDVLALKLTTSKPSSCFLKGRNTFVGNDGSGDQAPQRSPSNSLLYASQ